MDTVYGYRTYSIFVKEKMLMEHSLHLIHVEERLRIMRLTRMNKRTDKLSFKRTYLCLC